MADESDQAISRIVEERTAKITNVGPWQLGKIVGRGSSGTVRIAHHTATGQTAAVKMMSTEAILNSSTSVAEPDHAERLLQSIEREIVIMKLIEHPNVLGLLDVWEAKGLLFVVMEYIDGGELFDYIVERGRLSIPEALHYFQQIMYAVAYCHQFRIAHRDLKPENILLDGDNNVKVADFGMAAFAPRDSLLYTSCGSPHYASPEVVSGLAYDGTISDVWSCGVILYALLSGKLPFDDEDIRVLLDKVRDGKYTIPSDVPWPAQNLIRRMMEKDIERRIEVADVLKHPFFRSVPPHSQPVLAPTFTYLASIVPRNVGKVSIDGDIMKNMRTLWRNRQDQDIIQAIRNPQDNWEKIAYHLLYEFRMKRLKCIETSADGCEPRKKSRQRARPASTCNTTGSSGWLDSILLERPSAPTPSRARSLSVSDDLDRILAPSPVTAPLTPRKRTRTEPPNASSTGNETLPEIVIQAATPGRKGPRASLDSVLDYEDAYPGMLDPRPRETPKILEPGVPIDGPQMQEDVFFQQIAEMLVNMSKEEGEADQRPTPSGQGKAKLKLTGERPALRIKLPAGEVPPPPTTPATPAFSSPEAFGVGTSVEPTIRAVTPAGVLKPSNVPGLAHVEKTGAAVSKSVDAKENVPTGVLDPPRGRARSRTVGVAPLQLAKPQEDRSCKKSVRIVSPGHSTVVRTRKRSQSTGKDSPRLSDNWFSNLFHLKPVRHELYSVHDVFSTRSRCVVSLGALGAHVESSEPQPHTYGGSTLRCRVDEVVDPSGTLAVSKALKFRVEIRPSTGTRYAAGYLSEIALVLEKGQPASFAAFSERFKRGWELNVRYRVEGSVEVLSVYGHDAGVEGPLPSPALTAGGRYAEV